MAGMTAIETIYADVDVASFEVSSIPSTYQHLLVDVSVCSAYGGTGGDYFYIRLNGETSSSNQKQQIVIHNTATESVLNASGYMQARRVPTSGSKEADYGIVRFICFDYANTSKKNSIMLSSGSLNPQRVSFGGGMVTNTNAAVHTVAVICANGNMRRGSTMTIWGLEDA